MTANNIRPYKGAIPQIDPTAYVDPQAMVAGRVTIGADSSLWPMVAARGDVNYITIGERTNIQDGSILHVARISEENPEGFALIIGDEVTVGHGAIVHACRVGDRSLIGMGTTILDGAVIEDEVLLAAGSLVPPGKVLTGGYLWRGAPAVKVRPLTTKDRAWMEESITQYIKLKNEYMAILGEGNE